MSVRNGLRALEYVLLAVAIVCLSWYGGRMLQIRHKQAQLTSEVQRSIADIALPPGPPADGIIGQLDIPRLHLSAPVKTGTDDDVLDFSVGYLPDTPLPWTSGNSAFAAHRDRLFRPLERIRAGDAIRLSTPHGELNYHVLKTFIVEPTDVWVIGALPSVDLTLITCYPFRYVGSAPHRFIVQAAKTID
jgi:sortase A